MNNDKTKMYTADRRSCSMLDDCCIYGTLHERNEDCTLFRHDEGLYAFDQLQSVNGRQSMIRATHDGYFLIVPLQEDLLVSRAAESIAAGIGTALYGSIKAGTSLFINVDHANRRPYLFQYALYAAPVQEEVFHICPVPVDRKHNEFFALNGTKFLPFSVLLGSLYSKKKQIIASRPQRTCKFIHVLEGCCEIEERLLFAGDSLAIVTDTAIDLEGISAFSIILVFELSGKAGFSFFDR